MKWNKNEIHPDKVRELSEHYKVDLLIASILARRGVTSPEDVLFFLEDDVRFVHNPFLFEEMEEAVERIRTAALESEHVLIFGDRDVDGITSTVLMHEALQNLGVQAYWALPEGDEPYGITKEVIDQFDEKDVTLIITVDSGIANTEEIAYAQEKGMDTIVVDHHHPKEELPPAAAIINPKLPDTSYPFRDLAGCGVVLKLVWALEFAKTKLYNHPVCLLNIKPGNDTYILEAIKLLNLVEVDRITEYLTPGMVKLENTRLVPFFEGHEIYVYDENLQYRMLNKVFGNSIEIHLIDIAEELWKSFPGLRGKSLVSLREMSKLARYYQKEFAEVDVLAGIFLSWALKNSGWSNPESESMLDLVALGTIADLMPMKDENRLLVGKGLSRLSETHRIGLRELLRKQKLFGQSLSVKKLAWQVSPLINATGRMGQPSTAAQLLLETGQESCETLANSVVELNNERRKIGEEAWKRVMPQAEKSLEELGGRMVLVMDKQIHRGITGIIASRLAKYFSVPSMVVSIMDEKAIGSMRSTGEIPILHVLDKCVDLLITHGGHDFAAGFSMELDKIKDFKERITEIAKNIQLEKTEEESLEIDAELPASYLTPHLWDIVEQFAPYGEENPPLVFLTKNMRIVSMDWVGKTESKHLKLMLESGQYKWPAIYWNALEKVSETFHIDDKIDVVFTLGKNYFQNTENLQMTVLDLKTAG